MLVCSAMWKSIKWNYYLRTVLYVFRFMTLATKKKSEYTNKCSVIINDEKHFPWNRIHFECHKCMSIVLNINRTWRQLEFCCKIFLNIIFYYSFEVRISVQISPNFSWLVFCELSYWMFHIILLSYFSAREGFTSI